MNYGHRCFWSIPFSVQKTWKKKLKLQTIRLLLKIKPNRTKKILQLENSTSDTEKIERIQAPARSRAWKSEGKKKGAAAAAPCKFPLPSPPPPRNVILAHPFHWGVARGRRKEAHRVRMRLFLQCIISLHPSRLTFFYARFVAFLYFWRPDTTQPLLISRCLIPLSRSLLNVRK